MLHALPTTASRASRGHLRGASSGGGGGHDSRGHSRSATGTSQAAFDQAFADAQEEDDTTGTTDSNVANAVGLSASGSVAAVSGGASFGSMLREVHALEEAFQRRRRHAHAIDVTGLPITTIPRVAEARWTIKFDLAFGHYAFFKLSIPRAATAATSAASSGDSHTPRAHARSPRVATVSQPPALPQALVLFCRALGCDIDLYVSPGDGPRRPTRHEHTWALERGARELVLSSQSEPRFPPPAPAQSVPGTTTVAASTAGIFYIGVTCHAANASANEDDDDYSPPSSSLTPAGLLASRRAKESHSASVVLKVQSYGSEEVVSGLGGVEFAKKDLTTAAKVRERIARLKGSTRALAAFESSVREIVSQRLDLLGRVDAREPDFQALNRKRAADPTTARDLHSPRQALRDALRPHTTPNYVTPPTRTSTNQKTKRVPHTPNPAHPPPHPLQVSISHEDLAAGDAEAEPTVGETPAVDADATHAPPTLSPSGSAISTTSTAAAAAAADHPSLIHPASSTTSDSAHAAAAASAAAVASAAVAAAAVAAAANLSPADAFSPHITQVKPFHFHSVAHRTRPLSPRAGTSSAAADATEAYSTFGQNIGAVMPHVRRPPHVRVPHGRKADHDATSAGASETPMGSDATSATPMDHDSEQTSPEQQLQIFVDEAGISRPASSPSTRAALANEDAATLDSPRFLPGAGPASLGGARAAPPADFSLPFALDAPPLALVLSSSSTNAGAAASSVTGSGASSGVGSKARSKESRREKRRSGGSTGTATSASGTSTHHLTAGVASALVSGVPSPVNEDAEQEAAVSDGEPGTSKADASHAPGPGPNQHGSRFTFLESSGASDARLREALQMDVALDDVLRARPTRRTTTGHGPTSPLLKSRTSLMSTTSTLPTSPRFNNSMSSTTRLLSPSAGGGVAASPRRSVTNALLRSPIGAVVDNVSSSEDAPVSELTRLRTARDAESSARDETRRMLAESARLRRTNARPSPRERAQQNIDILRRTSQSEKDDDGQLGESLHATAPRGPRRRADEGEEHAIASDGSSSSAAEGSGDESTPLTRSASQAPQPLQPRPPIAPTKPSTTPVIPQLSRAIDQSPESGTASARGSSGLKPSASLARAATRHAAVVDLRSARQALSASLRARQGHLAAHASARRRDSPTRARGSQTARSSSSNGGAPAFRERADPSRWVSGVFVYRTPPSGVSEGPEARGTREALASGLPPHRRDREHIRAFLAHTIHARESDRRGGGGSRVASRPQDLLLEIHQSRRATSTRTHENDTERDRSPTAAMHSPPREAAGNARPATTPGRERETVSSPRRVHPAHKSLDASKSARASLASRNDNQRARHLEDDDEDEEVQAEKKQTRDPTTSDGPALQHASPRSPIPSAQRVTSGGGIDSRPETAPAISVSAALLLTPPPISHGDSGVTTIDEDMLPFVPPPLASPYDILAHIRSSSWWSSRHPSFTRLPTDALGRVALLLEWGRAELPRLTRTADSIEHTLVGALTHKPAATTNAGDGSTTTALSATETADELEHLESAERETLALWRSQQELLARARLGAAGAAPATLTNETSTPNSDASDVEEEAPTPSPAEPQEEEASNPTLTIEFSPSTKGSVSITPTAASELRRHTATLESIPSDHPLSSTAMWRASHLDRARWTELDRRLYACLVAARRRRDRLAWEVDALATLMSHVHSDRSKRREEAQARAQGRLVPEVPNMLPSEARRGAAEGDEKDANGAGGSTTHRNDAAARARASWGMQCFTPEFAELPPRPAQTSMERVMTARLEARTAAKQRREALRARRSQGAQTARAASSNGTTSSNAPATEIDANGTTAADDPFPPGPSIDTGDDSDAEAADSQHSAPAPPPAFRAMPLFARPPPHAGPRFAASTASSRANVWSRETMLFGRPRAWTKYMAPPEKVGLKPVFALPLRERMATQENGYGNMYAGTHASGGATGHANGGSDGSGSTSAQNLPSGSADPAAGADAGSSADTTEQTAHEQHHPAPVLDPAAAAVLAREQRQIALAQRSASYSRLFAAGRAERQAALSRHASRDHTRVVVKRGFSVSFDNQLATLVNPAASIGAMAAGISQPLEATFTRRSPDGTLEDVGGAASYDTMRHARQFGDEPLNMYLVAADTGVSDGGLGGRTRRKLDIYERDLLRRRFKERRLQLRAEAARSKAAAARRRQGDSVPPDSSSASTAAAAAEEERFALATPTPYDPDFDEEDFPDVDEVVAAHRRMRTTPTPPPPRAFPVARTAADLPLLSPALRAAQFDQLRGSGLGSARARHANIAEIDASAMGGQYKYISVDDIWRNME